MTKVKRKILIVTGRYLPGYKDGGPVRTIKNITDRLGDEYDFSILTTDRDHGDTEAYPGICRDAWNPVGKARVYYVQPGGFSAEIIKACAQDQQMIYMCGCFNDYARAVLHLLRKGELSCPVVIASMGLFSPGAFHIKYVKKKCYMMVLKALGYFRQVIWSATSIEECEDIRREVGKKATCMIAEDLPRLPQDVSRGPSEEKGSLRVIFLSRISRKKNLAYAIKVLQNCKEGNITFDIYGNREDPKYWAECLKELQELPANVQWTYRGEAQAEEVPKIFAQYDVFLFPTMAENYGHVILEALSGGCVPIISDRTPWTVEKMGGQGIVCELPLGDEGEALTQFTDAIGRILQMDRKTKELHADHCISFAKNYSVTEAENSYRAIFNRGGNNDA